MPLQLCASRKISQTRRVTSFHDITRPSPSIYDVKMSTQNQVKSKKKGHHVRRIPNFDSDSDTEQKKRSK